MRKFYLVSVIGTLLINTVCYSQGTTSKGNNSQLKWQANLFNQQVFIENKGQFPAEEQKDVGGKIIYYTRKGKLNVYFTSGSIVYRYDSVYKEGDDKEAEHENLEVKHEFLKMTWEGANPNPVIEVQEPVNNYFTYGNPADKTGKSGIKANGWKKLIYHNLYDGIDVEFFYPDKGGIEYTIIAKPVADIRKFKMHYSNNSKILINKQNALIIAPFTQLTDHAPNATISKDGQSESVPVSFTTLDNTISFTVNSVEKDRTLIIDPWISSPGFAGANKAYDMSLDLNGNIYIYGSTYPFLIDKFNSAGILQWTYASTFAYQYSPNFNFYGCMCVDGHSGSCFISEGYDQGSSQLIKVNTNGIQVATNVGNANYDEIWRLAYNNCEQKGVMLGGGTTGDSYQIAMLDTTLATLNPTQILVIGHMDFSMLALDNNGNCYTLDDADAMIKAALPTFSPALFNVPSGYTFGELTQPLYIDAGSYPGAGGNGFNGLVASYNYLYSYDGAILKKWNLTTGANLGSVTVHNIPFLAGGLAVNDCDDIFLGVADSVNQYDVSLNKTYTYLLPDTAYDMKLGANNILYACGRGFLCAVNVNPRPLSITSTMPSSCNACDGKATATVTCGLAPYMYKWSDGTTNQTDTGMCSGTYTITVTDQACPPQVDTATVILTGENGFTASIIDTNPDCALRKGNATAYGIGGNPPYAYLWSNGSTNQKDTGLVAGIYNCIITDNSGCRYEISVTLVNPTAPDVKVLPALDSICLGSNVILNASGAATYKWTPSLGLSCNNCPNPTATPSVTTIYSVTGTDSIGCTANSTAIIEVYPIPKPIITGKDSVCSGYIDTLRAAGGTTYKWSNGATTSSINYNVVGTQTITVTAYNGMCSHDTTFVINAVNPSAKITASKDSICPGDSVQLNGSGGATYKWNTGNTTTTIWVKPLVTKTYTLYAYKATCLDSATIKIKIIPQVTESVSATKDSICPHGSTTITATGSGGQVTYKWNTGATGSSITVTDTVTTVYTVTAYGICDSVKKTMTVTVVPFPKPVINGSSFKCKGQRDTLTVTNSVTPATYLWNNGKTTTTIITGTINADSTFYVTAFNSLGCPVTDTFHLGVIPYPTANITYPPGCGANITTITANASGPGNITYRWSTGGTNDTIDVYINADNTTYTVVISNDGCPITKTITVTKDFPALSACCDATIFEGNDTIINANGANIITYKWMPDTGLNCDTCASVIANPTVTTTYTVIGTDAEGCPSERTVTIVVETPCFNLTIPNVITPGNGGALGLDKVFYIKTENMNAWSLKIYDRWGKEVYNSTNPNEYWDGNTMGGGAAPAGVYYYIISGTCQNNTYKKDGFVQLIR